MGRIVGPPTVLTQRASERRMTGTRQRRSRDGSLRQEPQSLPMRFLRYLGLWTLIVIAFALQWHASDAMRGNTWRAGDYVRWSFVEFFSLALLAPGVLWLATRLPMEPRRLRHVPLHLIASLAFTGAALVLGSFISHFTEPGHPAVADQLSQFVAHHAVTAMITYWVLV